MVHLRNALSVVQRIESLTERVIEGEKHAQNQFDAFTVNLNRLVERVTRLELEFGHTYTEPPTEPSDDSYEGEEPNSGESSFNYYSELLTQTSTDFDTATDVSTLQPRTETVPFQTHTATLNEIVARGVEALKAWTSTSHATILYDSAVDDFTDDGIFSAVRDRANIAVVALTTDGDVFGGFYSVAVTEQDENFYDPNIFVFSFESRGRCETPQRFPVKEEKRRNKYVEFFKDSPYVTFVNIGGCYGYFYLGNEKSSNTYCHSLSWDFVGIHDTTLTGNTYPKGFTCTRIVAVHLQ